MCSKASRRGSKFHTNFETGKCLPPCSISEALFVLPRVTYCSFLTETAESVLQNPASLRHGSETSGTLWSILRVISSFAKPILDPTSIFSPEMLRLRLENSFFTQFIVSVGASVYILVILLFSEWTWDIFFTLALRVESKWQKWLDCHLERRRVLFHGVKKVSKPLHHHIGA